MNQRIVVRRAVHPEDETGKVSWVIFDTGRNEICDGAYMDHSVAVGVAESVMNMTDAELWEGDARACYGVTGWVLAPDEGGIP